MSVLCRVLEVSRSGYYAWKKRPKSLRQQENELLLEKILKSFEDSDKTYGVRRITDDLHDQGKPVNHKRIARIKRENGIYPKQYKAFVVTTDSDHDKPVARNFLRRNFCVEEPNQVWVTDLTYIQTQTGWLYLVVFIDLFSRHIVGWSMANHMESSLMIKALEMGIRNRGTSPDIVHSDRGCQYASDDFQDYLKQHSILCSMSRKGDCWDNAVAESFFGTLKTECIYPEKLMNQAQAKKAVFKYIETFYNRRRKHSFLKYLSPLQFEVKYFQSKIVA